VRGRLLKQLVKSWKFQVQKLKEEFPHKEVKKIVARMAKEKLITLKKWIMTIDEQ
jgi:hypothetical protein